MLGAANQVSEPGAHVVALRRKPGHSHANAPYLSNKRPRPVEDMNSRMLREPQVRDATALMVARHYINRHALVGDASQWLERLPHYAAVRARSIEHIAAMDDKINFAIQCRLQRGRVVGQEVVAATAPRDARAYGQVIPKMGVGE